MVATILLQFCQWVEGSRLCTVLRHTRGSFDVLDVVHTLGIVLVAGTIMLVDFRLLGLGLKRVRVSELVGRIVLHPWDAQ